MDRFFSIFSTASPWVLVSLEFLEQVSASYVHVVAASLYILFVFRIQPCCDNLDVFHVLSISPFFFPIVMYLPPDSLSSQHLISQQGTIYLSFRYAFVYSYVRVIERLQFNHFGSSNVPHIGRPSEPHPLLLVHACYVFDHTLGKSAFQPSRLSSSDSSLMNARGDPKAWLAGGASGGRHIIVVSCVTSQ